MLVGVHSDMNPEGFTISDPSTALLVAIALIVVVVVAIKFGAFMLSTNVFQDGFAALMADDETVAAAGWH